MSAAQSTEFILGLERRPCPKCTFLIPTQATVCSECKHRSQAGEVAPELPPHVRLWLLAERSEDSELAVVVRSRIDASSALALLGQHGYWGSLDLPQRRQHPRADWELEGRICAPTIRNPIAITMRGEEHGRFVRLWLTRDPAALTPRLAAPDDATRALLARPGFVLGIALDFHDRGDVAPFALHLALARALAPDGVLLDLSAGRVIGADAQPASIRDGYAIYVDGAPGARWIRSEGLPRWGAPDLEWFDIPDAHVPAAIEELHRAADALRGHKLPPPGDTFTSASRRVLRWRVASTGTEIGQRPPDRARFPYGSLVLELAG